ncbi:hypothetical protein GCM10012280_43890 [Wenjunlia tyrosinilytica]|uniref:Phosphate acetyltransferase n=1 Tax=Wenjunlia tyrosinilytica TaxID=1544741 RepID=A0A917ZTA3_9ACTN|nr:hypothetical protein GCM10012280_43890 [Wenjunlia tyrosinilytica]
MYITGIGRGDGRQVVELGVMDLLTRQVDRVGLFRPLRHADPGSPTGYRTDHAADLLRGRYRLDLPPSRLYGTTYEEAAELQAESGPDELVSRLVERFHDVARDHEVVLVLGTDFADTNLPAELAFNARLANEFGSSVLPVVGGLGHSPESVRAEVRNAYQAYHDLGCDIIAMIANRVAPGDRAAVARPLNESAPIPVYALPDEPALSAPTVSQVVEAVGGEVLLGDADGLARDVRDIVIGGAMLPRFLEALTEGCLVLTPGDRADLIIGSLAAHAAGSPPIAGILLTLDERPSAHVTALAARLAPGTPVISVPALSYPTATSLSALEGRLTGASPRKAEMALGLFELYVDTAELTRRLSVSRTERVTPMMFEHELLERARSDRRHVVLPEGAEERVLRAAEVLLRRNVCDLTLLGDEEVIRKRIADLGIDLGLDAAGPGTPSANPLSAHSLAANPLSAHSASAHSPSADSPSADSTDALGPDASRPAGLDPARPARARVVDPSTSPLRERFAEVYARIRAHRGMTVELAQDVVADVNYFGTLMVHEGLADGMVSGAVHSTAATIRPGFEIIRTAPGASIVSSVFFMCLADKVLAYADCAVNPDPDAEQLAGIAISSAATAAQFGVEPRVALLSYSTGTSGSGADVDKVRRATELVRERRPDLLVEGPIQYDAAVDPTVAATKLPDSPVAGRATVLVFPDLNTGNNTYKAVQRSAGAVAIGPVLQGLRKPVNDLSRGALVTDIVHTVAITAIQAQSL